jgi:hypothetical protein
MSKRTINWPKAAVFSGIASLLYASSGMATCDQVHPFSPAQIFYYDVNNSAYVDGIRIGGASGVDQRADSDCWFESSLAAVARFPQGARLISEMIAVSDKGGYEVTFQDEPHIHYHVGSAEIANLHLKDKATWADVLEAAGVKRFPQVTQGDAGDASLSKKVGEKLDAFGLTVMTGHQSELVWTNQVSVEHLAEILERNMFMNMAMTASSHPKSEFTVQYVVPNHDFTILNYEPWSGVVTLRNPWGKNSSPELPDLPAPGKEKGGVRDLGKGVIQLNIRLFPKYFHTVASSRIFHL